MLEFPSLKNIIKEKIIVRVSSFGKINNGYLPIIIELINTNTIHFAISQQHYSDLFEILNLSLQELPELLVHDNMLIRALAKYRMDRFDYLENIRISKH